MMTMRLHQKVVNHRAGMTDDDYDDAEFFCSDQSDYDNLSGFDDSDNDNNTSFQKNTSPNMNRIIGGPTKPDVSRMSKANAAKALSKYKIDRKKYTDKVRSDRVKIAQSMDTSKAITHCTGDNTDRIRPMAVVETKRLLVGQTFLTKDIVWMRIAEEANRRRIKCKTESSNHFNLYVSGDRFRVHVNFSEKSKWKVMVAAVRDGDEGRDNNIDDWLTNADGKSVTSE